MPCEIDALNTAQSLLDEMGASRAKRLLNRRAIDEYFADRHDDYAATQSVLAALDKLTRRPRRKDVRH